MDLINNRYETIELLKEDKNGCEYIVKDLYNDNMSKGLKPLLFLKPKSLLNI